MKPSSAPKYKLTNTIHEHQGRPVYCVSFNNLDPAHSQYFASSGGSRVCPQAQHGLLGENREITNLAQVLGSSRSMDLLVSISWQKRICLASGMVHH